MADAGALRYDPKDSMFYDVIQVLCRIGLVRRRATDRTVVWPISIEPWHMWKFLLFRADGRLFKRFALFRNRPEVVKWIPGRLLPRRWGFHILGLEIGDRGGGPSLIL